MNPKIILSIPKTVPYSFNVNFIFSWKIVIKLSVRKIVFPAKFIYGKTFISFFYKHLNCRINYIFSSFFRLFFLGHKFYLYLQTDWSGLVIVPHKWKFCNRFCRKRLFHFTMLFILFLIKKTKIIFQLFENI